MIERSFLLLALYLGIQEPVIWSRLSLKYEILRSLRSWEEFERRGQEDFERRVQVG